MQEYESYGGIIRNSLFEPTKSENQYENINVFDAICSRINNIPVEEEIEMSPIDDICAKTRA